MPKTSIKNPDIMLIFNNYPPDIHQNLMGIRQLIFDVAEETQGVGKLEETLKWGQPSYLTPETRSGSTIRIDRVKNSLTQYAMYFNCQTTLVETFRKMYPDLKYEGNRAIIFDSSDALPKEAIKDCIGMALTYHLRKRQIHK